MGWPKGKPRRPVPPPGSGAAQIEGLPPLVPEEVVAASSGPPDAPQPPPMADAGNGDVLMRGPNGRVTEVHPASVATMEDQGWVRYVA